MPIHAGCYYCKLSQRPEMVPIQEPVARNFGNFISKNEFLELYTLTTGKQLPVELAQGDLMMPLLAQSWHVSHAHVV